MYQVKSLKAIAISTLVLLLCACHPSTRVVGYVQDPSGKTVGGALVSLYGSDKISNNNGCFHYSMPDALPFELSVSAQGYSSVTSQAVPGIFKAIITLQPSSSLSRGSVIWQEIGQDEYQAYVSSCL